MNDENKNKDQQEGGNSGKIYVIKTLDKLDKKQTDLEKDHKKEEISSVRDITEIKTKMKMSSAIISIIVALVVGLAINVFSAYLISKWMDSKYDVKTTKEVTETIENKFNKMNE